MRNKYYSKKALAELTIYSLLLNFLVKLESDHLARVNLSSDVHLAYLPLYKGNAAYPHDIFILIFLREH